MILAAPARGLVSERQLSERDSALFDHQPPRFGLLRFSGHAARHIRSARNPAVILSHPLLGPGDVDIAGDDQTRVVRDIVLVEELLQLWRRGLPKLVHIADGRPPVAVTRERRARKVLK